jgi:hypothetical protein
VASQFGAENALQIACREKIHAYDAYFLECALFSDAPKGGGGNAPTAVIPANQ